MRITVEYAAQLKRAAGRPSEEVDLPDGSTVQDAADRIAAQHGDGLRSLLLDGTGRVHPSVLVFVGDEQVRRCAERTLGDGAVVTFASPISGG